MANWTSILKEIQAEKVESPIDIVRRKYIKKMANYTKRNVICYYSGFLNNSDHPDISINDRDLNSFMSVIHGLDKNKGLDLIIHSPGGDVCATEAIGNYLKKIFNNDIRIFIPQLAMSGGTMLACIGKEIYMGKHSSIGPIDPHIGGIPAWSVVQEFEKAKKDIEKNPQSIPFWHQIINKYPLTFVEQCYKAIELSNEVAKSWLNSGNMNLKQPKESTIENIINFLNSNEYTKVHARHINVDKAKAIGLNIIELENDDELQDVVLSVHHCYMHTLQNTRAVKILENQKGSTIAMMANK